MVTKQQAITARDFHLDGHIKRDGTCQTWRRNGRTQTWKRSPTRFVVPIKWGLRDYGYVTDATAHNFHTAEECPNIR